MYRDNDPLFYITLQSLVPILLEFDTKKIMFVSEIPTELIIGQDFKPYKPGSASLLFKFKGNLPDF